MRPDEDSSASTGITNGLMQGESLSPTLFSAFIKDIVDEMTKSDSMGICMNDVKLSLLY